MTIVVSGEGLTIADIAAAGRGESVALTTDALILDRFHRSRDVIKRGVETGEEIYGVTTLYGGMADSRVAPELVVELQKIGFGTTRARPARAFPRPTCAPRCCSAPIRSSKAPRGCGSSSSSD